VCKKKLTEMNLVVRRVSHLPPQQFDCDRGSPRQLQAVLSQADQLITPGIIYLLLLSLFFFTSLSLLPGSVECYRHRGGSHKGNFDENLKTFVSWIFRGFYSQILISLYSRVFSQLRGGWMGLVYLSSFLLCFSMF